MSEMTDEQIMNWRKALSLQYGAFAYLIPSESIIALRDRIQEQFTESVEVMKPCQCDPTKHGATTHQDGRVTCNKCQRERKP